MSKSEAQLDAEIAEALADGPRSTRPRAVGDLVICNGKPGKITALMPSGQIVVKVGAKHVQLDSSACGPPVTKDVAKAARRDERASGKSPRELQTDIDSYLAQYRAPLPAVERAPEMEPEFDRAAQPGPRKPLTIRQPDPVTGKMTAREVPGMFVSATPPVPRPRAKRSQTAKVTTTALAEAKPSLPTRAELAAAPAVVPAPTILKGYPAERIELAREAINKLQARLVTAARRQGQSPPEPPRLLVGAPYVIAECSSCRTRAGGVMIGRDHDRRDCGGVVPGRWKKRTVVDVELVAPPPRLNGWEFLAVIEPLTGGNLIKQMPGAAPEGFSFDPWRVGPIRCTHCNTIRKRLETFIVRHEDGRVQQVGRNCIKDFLGGKSADAILASMGFMDLIKEAGGADDEGGYSRASMPDEYDPLEVMTWTASVTRLDGFVSKKAAGEDKPSTSGIVTSMLSDPPTHPESRHKWLAARERFKPTPADEAKGKAVLAWAQSLAGGTDYELNVRLVASQPVIKASHIGTLASAIAGYDREHGTAAVRAARAAGGGSHWVGEIGKRLEWTLTVERIFDLEGQYGMLHIHTMRDPAGNAIVWKTTSKRLEPGETVSGKGTIKAHTEYKGEQQTEITRFG